MGILNITPDSFWDGGKYKTVDAALRRALSIQAEGADLLDVGAESTRPGSKPISLAEERKRLMPVLRALRGKIAIPVCVDTTKSQIAEEALELGVSIINDVSAMEDGRMATIIAQHKATVILMHRKGSSLAMQRKPSYRDCVGEIKDFLAQRVRLARQAGIAKDRVWIDPGIGFGKTLEHNVEIIKRLKCFSDMHHPVVLGLSRKSFLGALLDAPPADRLAASLAAGIVGALRGASVLRVHDVKETVHAHKVLEALGALQLNLAHSPMRVPC